MKEARIFLGLSLVFLMAGCGTTPVALGPVGPNPLGSAALGSRGQLQVFSDLAQQSDDQNQGSEDPIWYQHTDYRIYNLQGKLLRRVDNEVGYYSQAPRTVILPPGRYLVRADAKDYLRVQIEVIVKPGQTTRVHLDDHWKPPAATPKNEVVRMPNGNPVGWRVQAAKG